VFSPTAGTGLVTTTKVIALAFELIKNPYTATAGDVNKLIVDLTVISYSDWTSAPKVKADA
jgi:hypothetical protein